MGDFIFKCSGPQRAVEVQIPVSRGISELDAVKKLLGPKTEEEVEDNDSPKKKKKKKGKDSSTGVKLGTSTLGLLLASVIMSAMKED